MTIRQRYYDFAPVGYLTITEDFSIKKANFRASDMLKIDGIYLNQDKLTDFIDSQYHNQLAEILKSVDCEYNWHTINLPMKHRKNEIVKAKITISKQPSDDGSKQYVVTLYEN